MKPFKRRRLERKLALSVIGVALVIAAITSGVFFATELRRSAQKTTLMLEQLLDTVESTATIAAYTGNRQIGEDVLKGLLRNQIVHEARLSDSRGLNLSQARDTSVVTQHAVQRDLYSPFGDREVVGTITVVPEARFNLQEARYSALVNAINSTVLIGLTALIVLAVVRWFMSRPLMQVSGALHAISVGQAQRLEVLPRNHNDELGQLVRDINGLLDALEQKFAAERALREEIQAVEQQLRSIFVTTSAGIFVLDGEGRLLTANPSLERVAGLHESPDGQRLGQDFAALVFAEPERVRELMRQAEERGQAVALDLQLKNPRNGDMVWVHCLISRQTDASGSTYFQGVLYDVTERLEAEARAQHEANYDPLTGLLRRSAAERELLRLMKGSSGGRPPAVLLVLDLDNFKTINDSLGHHAGDEVLVETGRRIKACVRAGDIVARHGGDEFVIVLANCGSGDMAGAIARELVLAICQPILLALGESVEVGASIGVAVQTNPAQNADDLFRLADRAMYEVKRQGRNGYALAQDTGDIVELVSRGADGRGTRT
ncbi:sensor domain-containing diguanylate cyclase [Methyloterricola oryzae]|uniref:sensor domain-containing diguanylate cyclase n=1 Tax=Methyloterricola oryzae TaxID=1495050 RepID=UPI0005EAF949|nr:sensor domain-containing diguanylate cyclase [Methyloterricola oryzae]